MKYENASISLHAENVEHNVQTVQINCSLCKRQMESLFMSLHENKQMLLAIHDALLSENKACESNLASLNGASVCESEATKTPQFLTESIII